MEERASYTLVQSYVKRKWFVSTAYRQSSVMIEPPVPWYYETIVWEWDYDSRKTGDMLYTDDSGSCEKHALHGHMQICERLILTGDAEIAEDED